MTKNEVKAMLGVLNSNNEYEVKELTGENNYYRADVKHGHRLFNFSFDEDMIDPTKVRLHWSMNGCYGFMPMENISFNYTSKFLEISDNKNYTYLMI